MDRLFDHFPQIKKLHGDLQSPSFDLREVQHVVDQLEKLPRVVPHNAQLFFLLLIQRAGQFLLEDSAPIN